MQRQRGCSAPWGSGSFDSPVFEFEVTTQDGRPTAAVVRSTTSNLVTVNLMAKTSRAPSGRGQQPSPPTCLSDPKLDADASSTELSGDLRRSGHFGAQWFAPSFLGAFCWSLRASSLARLVRALVGLRPDVLVQLRAGPLSSPRARSFFQDLVSCVVRFLVSRTLRSCTSVAGSLEAGGFAVCLRGVPGFFRDPLKRCLSGVGVISHAVFLRPAASPLSSSLHA